MNKKLMAVAVAGAFVTPALVYAQNATVQVYGRFTAEYGYADQGNGRPKTDEFQTPGGTAVGFKGEEQLGGGLAAWFQCESSADVRGLGTDGFCGRNSALGLKGGWGNAYFGKWDTPFKKAMIGMVGAGDTGLLGAAFTFAGNSAGVGAVGGQGGSQSIQRVVWKRREGSMISYDSPSFSGFQVMAAYSSANATAVTSGTANPKPRVGSIAGLYSNGPLNIGLGYEKHYSFGNGLGGAAGTGNDDRGWTIGASYNFMGNLLVGIQYLDTKYELGSGTDAKKKNWFLGADWNFSGPHHLIGAYVNAGDTKGSASAAQVAAIDTSASNGAIQGNSGAGQTGADFWEIMYGYDLSKRTLVRFGYVKLNNDSNAIYTLGGTTPIRANAVPPAVGAVGTNQSAWVMYGQHSW